MKRNVAPPPLDSPKQSEFYPPDRGYKWAKKMHEAFTNWSKEMSDQVSTHGQNRGVTPQVASAATLAVTAEIMHITGVAEIDLLTVPPNFGGAIEFIPDDIFTLGVVAPPDGNIALAATAVVGKTMRLTFSPLTQLWYPSYT